MGNKASSMSTSSLSTTATQLNSAHAPMKTIRILTYNVWFDSLCFDSRMKHIIDKTLALQPDVCCFQEVLPGFAAALQSHAELNTIYAMSPFTTSGYGTMTLARRALLPRFDTVDFPTRMGRSLLKTTCRVNGADVAVGNVHLESLSNEKTRKKQLSVCRGALKKDAVAILVGDFNFCSERNFLMIPNHPLENDVLQQVLPEYVDVWPFVHNSRQSSNSTAKRDIGYTFDSEVNRMISHEERMRYDRVMARCGKSGRDFARVVPAEIELVGTQPLTAAELEQCDSGERQQQVWPSDHFGLLATFKLDNGEQEQPVVVSNNSDDEETPPIPPKAVYTNGAIGRAERPAISLNDVKLKQAVLATGNETIITRRDGSRYVERVDKETGVVTTVPVDNVSQQCGVCGVDMGFQLEVRTRRALFLFSVCNVIIVVNYAKLMFYGDQSVLYDDQFFRKCSSARAVRPCRREGRKKKKSYPFRRQTWTPELLRLLPRLFA
mmetsp:Transcript_27831/g.47029  ORF Transcript_27831/g.47029 Transcript_27831/m.47029 type:complete len:493 (-) Transcript_27831:1418-2896(-)